MGIIHRDTVGYGDTDVVVVIIVIDRSDHLRWMKRCGRRHSWNALDRIVHDRYLDIFPSLDTSKWGRAVTKQRLLLWSTARNVVSSLRSAGITTETVVWVAARQDCARSLAVSWVFVSFPSALRNTNDLAFPSPCVHEKIKIRPSGCMSPCRCCQGVVPDSIRFDWTQAERRRNDQTAQNCAKRRHLFGFDSVKI